MIFKTIAAKLGMTTNHVKVVRNVSWAVLGKVVRILTSLFVGILVARYLGPDQYGLMNYVVSYVALFSVLSNFGLSNIEIREMSKDGANINVLMGTAFSLRLFFSIVTVILILITLIVFESDAFTFTMVMVYSLSLIFSSFGVISTYFASIILNEYVVKTEIFRLLVGAAIKIILLIQHFSLSWFIIASTFEFLLVAGGYTFSYRKKGGVIKEWKFEMDVAKMYIRQSFPLLLSGTAVIVYQKVDQIMIRNMIDTTSLGHFSVAGKITELIVFIPIVISQTVTPILVKAHQKNNSDYLKKRQQFMDLMVWIAVFMALITFLLAKPAISILYGEEYLKAIPVLQVMAWRAIFTALFASSGQIIIIEGLQKYAVLRNLYGVVICVVLNLLLIPRFGIIGSAFATILTLAFSSYISHLFIKPYRFLFKIQTRSILTGWIRTYRLAEKRLSKLLKTRSRDNDQR